MEAAESSAKTESKKDLFRQLDILKNQIISLRKDLNSINYEKELWFSKKEEYYKLIREKISIMRESREKRDSLTKKVKELKEKRNAFSGETGKKISEFKKLNDEKKKLLSKSRIRDPYMLKGDIEKLELKLETEVMPFDKEKQLSKKVKALKKSLLDVSDSMGILEKIKALSREINESRKDANNAHDEIQELAKQSQALHEELLKASKEVDGLKAKEEEAFRNFVIAKSGFTGINGQLKENLAKMSGIREKINKFTLQEEEKRKLGEMMLIQSKEKEIEEKFKAGKKLTTDDFLMFQDIIKK
ncbi:hypothetical protein HYU09_02495 [Candidatus Woesearchaeota archaeon]|nr:hypothetical protein [Candidatus Woesearchaeota archaeon]